MKRLIIALFLCRCCSTSWAAPPSDAETAAIQAQIDAYVVAFNKADAAALAALWTEQGEMIGPEGDRAQGREQIQKQFADYFATAKDAKLELEGTRIELQSPSTAVETGLARVVVPDEEPSETQYRAVHLKTPDGWRIDGVREAEPATPAPSHYEQLQQLAWLVGDWSDADGNSIVSSSVRWSKNRNFLIQSFRVGSGEDDDEFEGTQVIGWDPKAQAIRSWTFDSDGGFGSGRWTGEDKTWTVRILHMLPDGRVGSAVNVYEVLGDDSIRYRSTGRQVDGELMPSVGPVDVVRRK